MAACPRQSAALLKQNLENDRSPLSRQCLADSRCFLACAIHLSFVNIGCSAFIQLFPVNIESPYKEWWAHRPTRPPRGTLHLINKATFGLETEIT